MSHRHLRTSAALAAVPLLFLIAACSSATENPSHGASSATSPRVVVDTACLTPSSTTTAPPAAAAPPAGGDPLAGVWETAKLDEAQITAAVVAAGGVAIDGPKLFHSLAENTTHDSVVISLGWDNGTFVETEAADGHLAIHEATGTYKELPNHVVLVTGKEGTVPCTNRWTYSVTSTTLRLHHLKHCNYVGGIYDDALFASFPFTKD